MVFLYTGTRDECLGDVPSTVEETLLHDRCHRNSPRLAVFRVPRRKFIALLKAIQLEQLSSPRPDTIG